jgi:hypothetical protein
VWSAIFWHNEQRLDADLVILPLAGFHQPPVAKAATFLLAPEQVRLRFGRVQEKELDDMDRGDADILRVLADQATAEAAASRVGAEANQDDAGRWPTVVAEDAVMQCGT